ncbi:MAG: M28 family metallopeptidase, partial [Bacteroidota bacterium]
MLFSHKGFFSAIVLVIFSLSLQAQSTAVPPSIDLRMYNIIDSVSADRIEVDIRKLVSFGTRNTLSDTVSETRGIGAARRWIKSEFKRISDDCGGCLEISEQAFLVKKGENRRFTKDVQIVNVVAIQRGTRYPDRYVIMSSDIDSRPSDVTNDTIDSPGANDNASGVAGTLEAARVLSKYKFENSIIYATLSGEEQGLFGGKFMAKQALEQKWDIIGVLNNDMIGNIHGLDGVIDNSSFRIFSEPTPVTETDAQRRRRRFYGGEVDGISRQLARYIARTTETYMTNLKPILIYRLDRFGRGGHHRPFNDEGFAGIRIMETHEHYHRQHQDIRVEDGIEYGDVIEGVNFEYAAKLTAVNAINLASLAAAPPAPKEVKIGGVVKPDTKLAWELPEDEEIAGYKLYWRETTAPQWQYSRYVGKVSQYTLKSIIIDNYLFGVAAVGKNGHESPVVFP